jgi:hypothetical protein
MSEKAFTLSDKMSSFYIQPVDQFYDDQTVTSFISDIDSADIDTSTNTSVELDEPNVKLSDLLNINNIRKKVEILKFRSIQMFQILRVKNGKSVSNGLNKRFSGDNFFN